jgi:small-conductance mechanosensitive channel
MRVKCHQRKQPSTEQRERTVSFPLSEDVLACGRFIGVATALAFAVVLGLAAVVAALTAALAFAVVFAFAIVLALVAVVSEQASRRASGYFQGAVERRRMEA